MQQVKFGRLLGLVLGLLFFALIVLIFFTWSRLRDDRAELVRLFSEERLRLLLDASKEVEGDIQDIADDLILAARLVEGATSDLSPRSVLEAVLSLGRAYQGAVLFDAAGRQTMYLTDPRRGGPSAEIVTPAAAALAKDVMGSKDEAVHVSALFENEDKWLRIFAIRLPVTQPDTHRVLALVVDMQTFLAPFKHLSADAQTHLLILGPHGDPAPLSSETLRRVLSGAGPWGKNASSGVADVLSRMEHGQTGVLEISRDEAALMGLGYAETAVVYAPISLDKSRHWSAATFASLAVLEGREQSLLFRMGIVSAAAAIFLILVSVYVFISIRNRAILSERVRYLDEVAHLNEKARRILDSIPVGALVMSGEGRVTDMNRELALRRNRNKPGTALDYSRIETIFGAPSTPSGEAVSALIRKAKSTREPSGLIGRRLSVFGVEGFFTVHTVPLASPSKESDLLLVIEDLSEVKRLELQMLGAEKLATVGVLSAGIAHEIGTPLGVVRGRAELMMSKLSSEDPNVKSLQIILDQIDRVVRIIHHLLDFARPKPVMTAPSDTAQIIRKCTDFLKIEADRRKLTLDVMLEEKLPRIIADPDQLEQVLVNLIMNAFDACKEGARVTVSARKSTMDSKALEMTVTDTGCGIPAEDLQRVFDPFYSTKKRGKSTGLGLSTVSQIVRSHQADIRLDSAVGQGTAVTISWPVAESIG